MAPMTAFAAEPAVVKEPPVATLERPSGPDVDAPAVKEAKAAVDAATAEATQSLSDAEALLRDLTLTDEQRKKVNDLIALARRDIERVKAKIPNKDQQDAAIAALRMQINAVVADYHARMVEILSPEQALRIDQLIMKTQGWKSVNNATIADRLQLTDDQRTQIQVLIDQSKVQTKSALSEIKPKTKADRQARKKLRKDSDKQLTESIRQVLTADQQKAFENLKTASVVTTSTVGPAVPQPTVEAEATLGKEAPQKP